MRLILTIAQARPLWCALVFACASAYSLQAKDVTPVAPPLGISRKKSQTMSMPSWMPTGRSIPTRSSTGCRPKGSCPPRNIGNRKMPCRFPRNSFSIRANWSPRPDEGFATVSSASGPSINAMPPPPTSSAGRWKVLRRPRTVPLPASSPAAASNIFRLSIRIVQSPPPASNAITAIPSVPSGTSRSMTSWVA